MAARKPLVVGSDGLPQQLQPGDKPSGFWAKAVATTATGGLATTIPAGIFSAAPIVTGTPVVPAASRDYILTLTAVTYNPTDKTVSVVGFVRRTNVLAVLGDTTSALPSAVTVHLIAMESD